MEFKIKVRSDASGESGTDGHALTHIAQVGDKDVFKGRLCQESGVVQASRFDALCDDSKDFELTQLNRSGIRRIEVKDGPSGRRLGEIYGNRILADGEVVVVEHLGCETNGRHGGRGAQMISLRRQEDDSEIGWIETTRATTGGRPWTRFLEVFTRRSASTDIRLTGEVISQVVDFRLIIASCVLFDIERA